MAANPTSPWRVSVLTNLGLLNFDAGYFSQALADWTQAWNIGKTAPEAHPIVTRALAEALKMNCRVGRVAEAKALLAELGDRPLSGLNATMIDVSRKAVVQMETMPKDCFKCGPFALSSILAHDKKHTSATMNVVTEFPTTAQGTSLAQVKELANTQLGMEMQAAKRLTAQAPILFPAVINWKLNHYGALLNKDEDRYLMADPTFGTSQWIGADAINQESSGYFLVPAGPLPEGWAAVDDAEAATIWGRGDCAVGDGNGTGKNDPKKGGKGGGCGMAGWSIHHSLASLNIEDIPLFYDPPAGPLVRFRVNYSQLEQNQPTTINFSNLGALWNLSWVSYLTFDSANARARMGEGGTELYTNFNGATGTYSPDQSSHARLVRVAADNYERRQSDGSKMVFNLPDGTGRLFATQIVDAQGNALTLAYDANFRLASLTDAVGQVTMLTHGSDTPGDARFYLVTKVTDPFGRFATLAYDASNRLTSVTDQIGITSLFTYTASNLVHTLTTPYGTTTFDCGNATIAGKGVVSHVQVTEPDGSQQRVESCQYSTTPASDAAVPTGMPLLNQYLNYRNSYYWDAKAMLVAPGDYTKANITHFLHLNASNIKANVPESEKNALESRVWYFYHNQNLNGSIYTNEGMGAHPTHIGRVMDDGSTQLYQYEYNDLGNMTKSIDPLGRTVVYNYAANGIDLLTVKRVKPGGAEELLATFSWTGQHQPATITKPSGETLSFTYNARGQATSATNARGDTSTYVYNALGQLTSADGPLPGTGDQCTFTYDAEGRVNTMTRDSYTIDMDHDALNRPTRVTYPDGSYEQVTYTHLDPTQVRDRAGRITTFAYNPVQQLISITDPLSRTVRLEWCTCGSLRRMIDAMGRITSWDEDLQGRTISKSFSNHTKETYVYEATNSRLAKITDGRGQSKAFAYHLDDSVATLGYRNTYEPTPGTSYVYDPVYPRLVSMTDGQGVTTYTYGAVTAPTGANQLKEVKTLWDGVTVAYAYDKLGRVESRSVNGVAQSFARDAGGRTTSLTNSLGTFGFTFDGATRRVTGISLPNGQSVVASYFGTTGHRRLQQVRNVQPNAATLSQFDLTYNLGGEISSWAQQSGASPAQNYNLGYDAARQLTSMNAPGRDFGFTYDFAGNLKTKTLNGSTTSFSHNVLNELQSASPALGEDKAYVWDGENRLAGIGYTGTSRFTRFKYDGVGRCVEISEHDGFSVTSVKRFVWSRLERVEERDGSGNVTRRFFPQGEQIGGASYYYSFDHLGSVREMTDSTGAVRARYDYDPYGVRTKVAGDLEAAKGFTGHYYHAPSGLHLTMYRAYDGKTGRWLSRDPLGENAGLNLYAYVRNGPVNAVDPLGMIDAWGFGTAALGVAGGAAGMAAGGAVMLAGSAATVTIPLAGQVGGPAAIGLGFGAATLGAVNAKRNLDNLAAAWNDQPAPSKGGVFADAAEALAPGNGAAAAVGVGLDMATGGMAGGVADAAHGAGVAARVGEAALKNSDEAMAGLGAAAGLGGLAKDALEGGGNKDKADPLKPTPHPRGALPGTCLK
ncbi:MAG TPA: RHS repeat-associated core domain-containing protein [Prosthecobacter sp.]